ncbi:MAG: hypothetical protein WA395_07645 [Nitrososphaeraceae archaeon]|jgi:hypothetical protein
MNTIRNSNDDSKRIRLSYWKWFFIFIAIGIGISLTIPFPISFAVYLLMFVLINALRLDYHLRKSGVRGGIKELYKSLPSSFGVGNGSSGSAECSYSPLKFYCMNCGKEHKERTCPKCGSTAVSIG